MPNRLFLFLVLLATATQGAMAREIKTSYAISGSRAAVTTSIVKATAEQEKLMRGFLFKTVADKLRTLPMVSGIEFNDSQKGEKTTSSYMDYWEHKRSFPVIVHLALPSAVSLMMRVEEVYRSCKSPGEKNKPQASAADFDDWGGGGGSDVTVDCTLQATAKITGPFAVYGNFASSVDVQKLLREKQYINYEVSRDWSDKTTMKIEGSFYIESELFDANLLKFMKAFNLAPANSEGILTRNNLLLGIARILRVQNERMVEK
ncbi:MAG: hypothetical protein AB7F86_03165 [Bdellovibrionales bacterium]